MRGYDNYLSPPTPAPVTPDLIGGPCLPPSTTMDTRMRGYDNYLVTPAPCPRYPRLDRGSMPTAFDRHGYPKLCATTLAGR